MSTRDQAIQRTARKIRDVGSDGAGTNALLTDTDIGEEVDAAVVQYSLDAPRIVVTDITAVTSPYFNVTTLTGWVNDWSRLISVEWQAAAVGANYQPSYLDLQDSVADYQDGSNRYLYFRNNTPASGDTTRFRYTVPHTLTNVTDTILTPHFDAVCDLAAAYCCSRLEAHFAAASDPTIAADSVNYRDSQLRFRQAREEFEKQYRRKVGLSDSGPAPSGVVVDWDTLTSWGQDRLTHQRRWR